MGEHFTLNNKGHWNKTNVLVSRAPEIRQMFSYQEPLTRDNCSNIKGPWNKTNVLVSRALKWYNCFHIKGPEMIQLFSYQGRLTCDNSSKIKGPEMIQKFSNQGPWNDAKGSQIKGPEMIQKFSNQGPWNYTTVLISRVSHMRPLFQIQEPSKNDNRIHIKGPSQVFPYWIRAQVLIKITGRR